MSAKNLDSLISLLRENKQKMEQHEAETNMQILLELLHYLRKQKFDELNEIWQVDDDAPRMRREKWITPYSSSHKIRREKWITHYSSSHKILLVGEGDFSFSACLARAFGSAHNIVATSLDSKALLPIKHWSSVSHIQELNAYGCTILHDVDVNYMHEHKTLKTMKFDRIVFNFPHAGHDPLYCEHDGELIRRHKELMKAFFASAIQILAEDGEIHVSHRNDYPYIRWKLVKLAKKVGLILIEMAEFQKENYPGYHNKRGGGINSNKTFPLNECFTFKFALRKCFQDDGGSTISEVDSLSFDLSSLQILSENMLPR